jgi:hypothetical protein
MLLDLNEPPRSSGTGLIAFALASCQIVRIEPPPPLAERAMPDEQKTAHVRVTALVIAG